MFIMSLWPLNISSKHLSKAGMSLQPYVSNRWCLGLEDEVVYFLKLVTKKNVEMIKVAVEIIMETLMGFINLYYAHGILL